ncbi:hypothetical protein [Streptomyces lavendulae]|uniref:hypothetical protein n=1 Tax=Streptomyces lavendulae TaxID=1914 RepID=UPI003815EA42
MFQASIRRVIATVGTMLLVGGGVVAVSASPAAALSVCKENINTARFWATQSLNHDLNNQTAAAAQDDTMAGQAITLATTSCAAYSTVLFRLTIAQLDDDSAFAENALGNASGAAVWERAELQQLLLAYNAAP